MDFLRNNRLFDFLYGGKPFSKLKYNFTQIENNNTLISTYTFPDGLVVTNSATKYSDGYEWVTNLENTSNSPTEIISELFDANITLPLPYEEPLEHTAFLPKFNDCTTIYAPSGSNSNYDEFCSFADRREQDRFIGHILPGMCKTYAPTGGRSSDTNAPFFNIHKNGIGYIFAIGWTGQWNCFVNRSPDSVTVKTKIEDTCFKLMPGEKFRTSSFVLMPYEGDIIYSQNKWRELIRKHFSLIGKSGRTEYAPLCAGVWGGMKTSSVIERVNTIKQNELPFEYIWMDAGWYGKDTMPSPDEFEGDWYAHTGEWEVSKFIHPGKLKDVSKTIHKAGMKFLLWFEPERVRREAPIVSAHPEYFLPSKINDKDDNLLLNLGDEAAFNYCFNTLAELIEDIGIDCYRQDFNISPLQRWREYDSDDRKGITEIKHINGLYRLWDALLEKFPNLIIDNCASGGKRIDIETLRRSVPLWRSDYQCSANFLAEGSQKTFGVFS